MRDRVTHCLATVMLAALLVPCAQAAQNWTRVAGPKGEFEIRLPGKADVANDSVKLPEGPTTIRIYTVIVGEEVFLFGHMDYPAKAVTRMGSARILQLERDAFLKELGMKATASRAMKLGPNPGHEVRADGLLYRQYLVGRRLYYLAYSGSDGGTRSPSTQRFFNSFKVK